MSKATKAKAIGLPSDGRAAIADKLSLRRERCLSCFRNCENMKSAGVSNSERRSGERHRSANAAHPQLCAVWLIDHCAVRFSTLIEIPIELKSNGLKPRGDIFAEQLR